MKYLMNLVLGLICLVVFIPMMVIGQIIGGIIYTIWSLNFKKGLKIMKGAFDKDTGPIHSTESPFNDIKGLQQDKYWEYQTCFDLMLSKKTWITVEKIVEDKEILLD